jgi:hypothetical protein
MGIMSEEAKSPEVEIKPEEIQLKIAEAETQEPPVQRHPAEGAAAMFGLYFPIFKNLLLRLSNKQLRRLLSALVEVPLNGDKYKALEEAERQVYLIGDKLLQAKWSMILYTLMEHQAELEAAKNVVDEANNQLSISEVKEGENNG